MRPEVVEKRLNSIQVLSRQGKRINGLFRLLACPLVWERAYETIAPNKGALTPGIDPANILDGFSLERMNQIIATVMDGSYRFSPVRRHYIPKANGAKRPLGIPTADDKLVQAAVKLLLEHVFEPVFSDQSHGFRRGRSCHTALDHIRGTWHGVKWLVEVDVVGFYDHIDHDILLTILRKRIDDERLIRLIGRMLKAGYMEDWTLYETFSGAPQGGVISPILSNIYLNELDEFMQEMKERFDKGRKRRMHPEYQSLTREIEHLRRKIKRRKATGDESEIPSLLAEIRDVERKRLEVPCSDWFDPDYRRLLYCRYADDFIIGVIGGKDDARHVMAEVRTFLAERLKLTASEEKSGISKASEGTTFLGYTVKTHTGQYTRRRAIMGRVVSARPASDRVQLHVPHDKLAKFVERKRLGSYHANRGEMRPELTNNSDLAILTGYNALMRGLAEYYKLGSFWKQELGRVYHLWWWSLHKTLARKHKCSVAKIAAMLHAEGRHGLWFEQDGRHRHTPVFRLADVNARPVVHGNVDRVPQEIRSFGVRSDITDRLKAKVCGACGATDVPLEIHHVRRLRDMQQSPLWAFVQAARVRKRIVLCHDCHVAHHAGRLQARLDHLVASVGAG